jgi:hypothetical protein
VIFSKTPNGFGEPIPRSSPMAEGTAAVAWPERGYSGCGRFGLGADRVAAHRLFVVMFGASAAWDAVTEARQRLGGGLTDRRDRHGFRIAAAGD